MAHPSELRAGIEKIVAKLTQNIEQYPATPHTQEALTNLNLSLSALKTCIEIEEIQQGMGE